MISTPRLAARLILASFIPLLFVSCQQKPLKVDEPQAEVKEVVETDIVGLEEAPKLTLPKLTLNVPAFRSVLDGKPRMLTVPLDDTLWLAYDTTASMLYKAWPGQ